MKTVHLFFGIALLVSLVLLFFTLQSESSSDAFSVKDGRISYPLTRPLPAFNQTLIESSSDHELYEVDYTSRSQTIYSLVRIPKNVDQKGTVVILPGSTVTKEGRQPLAIELAKAGFASIALDERGNGKTPAFQISQQEDFENFKQGKEVEHAILTLDALKAMDVVRTFPVNKKTIFLGESMGGRFAIIAAAIDPSISGVLMVSSAGYGLPKGNTQQESDYIRLIDPDNYVSLISPRPVYFIHNENDNVIPFATAQHSYELAGNPKNLTVFNACSSPHGLCPGEIPLVVQTIAHIFSTNP